MKPLYMRSLDMNPVVTTRPKLPTKTALLFWYINLKNAAPSEEVIQYADTSYQ
jgi:hypothetical protein